MIYGRFASSLVISRAYSRSPSAVGYLALSFVYIYICIRQNLPRTGSAVPQRDSLLRRAIAGLTIRGEIQRRRERARERITQSPEVDVQWSNVFRLKPRDPFIACLPPTARTASLRALATLSPPCVRCFLSALVSLPRPHLRSRPVTLRFLFLLSTLSSTVLRLLYCLEPLYRGCIPFPDFN